MEDAVRKYMSDLGKKGGKKRHETLTPEEKSELGRKGAIARWKNHKKKEGK